MKSTILICCIIAVFLASPSAGQAPGGFIEKSYYPAQRPVPDLSFVPTTASVFTFPAPYNTKGYRLTLDSDPLTETNGYSYWPKINNHKGNDTMYVIVGEKQTDIGTILYSINKVTDEVTKMGSLFPLSEYAHYYNAGLMYWSLSVWNMFYYFAGSQFHRYYLFENRTEIIFDSMDFRPNTNVWQMHSSADGMVHSLTLKDSNTYADLACAVYFERNNTLRVFDEFAAISTDFDECQVDKSGRYLVIKINDLDGKRLLVHVDLETGDAGFFKSVNGAYGHSDTGYAAVVGQTGGDTYAMSGFRFDFPQMVAQGYENYWQNYTYVYRSEPYPNNYGGPDHYAWTNAKDPNQVPYEKQFACGGYGKTSTGYSHDFELMCFRLDGSFDTLIVAPFMSNIPDETASTFYDNAPKAVLDPTGDYAFWTANLNTNRLYAFVVQVPWQLLVSEQEYNPNGPFAPPKSSNTPSSNQTPTTSKTPGAKPTIAAASTMNLAFVLVLLMACMAF